MSDFDGRNQEDTKITKAHEEERLVEERSSCASTFFVLFVVPAPDR